MARADETLMFSGDVSELDEAHTPAIGVRSMGETHYGDTHFGDKECGRTEFEPAGLGESALEASAGGDDEAAASTQFGPPPDCEGTPSHKSANERSATLSAGSAWSTLGRAASLRSRGLARRPALSARNAVRLRWLLLVVVGGAVGLVAAWAAMRGKLQSAETGSAAVAVSSLAASSDATASPATEGSSGAQLRIEVLGPTGDWVEGAAVHVGQAVTLSDGQGPVPVSLPPGGRKLRVECPAEMRGGPLVRSFNPRLLPQGRPLKVRLTCRPVLQSVPLLFSSGPCESRVTLSTGESFETQEGKLEASLQLDVESLGKLTVSATLRDESCRFQGPEGSSRRVSRVIALDGRERVERIELEVETERARPRRPWRRGRSPEPKRPYRL